MFYTGAIKELRASNTAVPIQFWHFNNLVNNFIDLNQYRISSTKWHSSNLFRIQSLPEIGKHPLTSTLLLLSNVSISPEFFNKIDL